MNGFLLNPLKQNQEFWAASVKTALIFLCHTQIDCVPTELTDTRNLHTTEIRLSDP